MVKEAIVYLSFHEPRRLKLPPDPIPRCADLREIRACLLDEEATQAYFRRWLDEVCAPYTRALTTALSRDFRFLVHVSGPLMDALANSADETSARFVEVLRHPYVTVVCSEPKHSLSFYLDIETFQRQMGKAADLLAERIGACTSVGMAPQMSINNEIYCVLGKLGFRAIVADGTKELLQGRQAGFLRKNGGGPFLCTRLGSASHRLGAVLDGPPGIPFGPLATEVAQEVAGSAGDVALLGWEVHRVDGGIDGARVLAFLEQLSHELLTRGVGFSSIGEVTSRCGGNCSPLPLPSIPAVASEVGSMGFFLGHPIQRTIFGLMGQAYSAARLTESEDLVDIALELAQLDILGLVNRLLISNGHRQEPFYLTPAQWSRLGVGGVLAAVPEVYATFIQGITESFL